MTLETLLKEIDDSETRRLESFQIDEHSPRRNRLTEEDKKNYLCFRLISALREAVRQRDSYQDWDDDMDGEDDDALVRILKGEK